MHKVHHTLVVSLLVVSGLVAAAPAFAQAEVSKDSARFIEFDPTHIPGNAQKSTVYIGSGRVRARFDRLLVLKKSVRPAMLATGGDLNLK
jgi:hypothetical protein